MDFSKAFSSFSGFSGRRRPAPVRLLAATALAGVFGGGCALVLGFDDTTLRQDGIDASTPPSDANTPPVDAATGERLRAEPSSLVLRRGTTASVQVLVTRGTDVTVPLTARLDGLPQGVTASIASLGEGVASATLTIDVASTATPGAATLTLAVDPPLLPPFTIPALVADGAGTPDKTFGGAGEVTLANRGVGAKFYALSPEAGGSFLAVGSASPAAWLVRRFASDGATDAAFVTASAGLPPDGEARAIGIDGSKRIVVVGTSAPPVGVAQLTVVRLDAAGKLDPSFGGTGIVRLASGDAPLGSQGFGVAIGADGGIVVAGVRRDSVTEDSGILVRFKADGTRDTTWNAGAIVAVSKTRFVGVHAVDGDAVVAAGTDATQTLTSYALLKRTATGVPDPAFGTVGLSTFGLGFRARGSARLPNGAIALVGDSTQAGDTYTGGLASNTGAQVWVRGFATGNDAVFNGVAAQADGRLVAAGGTIAPNAEARVDRILDDAGLDPSFGDAGTAIVAPGGVADGSEVALYAAAVQADGRILVAGNRSTTGAIVIRLWP